MQPKRKPERSIYINASELKMTKRYAADPIAYNDRGWWFYDETWSEVWGPYPTEQMARMNMWEHAKIFLAMDVPWWP